MLLSGNYSPIIPTFNSMSPSGKKPPIGTHIESSTKAYTAIGIIKDRPSETDIEAKKKAYKYEVVSLIASMEGLSFKTGASTTNQEKINELFNEDIPALELRLRDLISKQLTTDHERLKAENEYLKMHLRSLLLPTISKDREDYVDLTQKAEKIEKIEKKSSSQQNNPQIFASLPSTLSNTTSVPIQRTFIHYTIPPDVAVPGRAKSEPPPIL